MLERIAKMDPGRRGKRSDSLGVLIQSVLNVCECYNVVC